uniref:Uncharacterized protein n=1 Tax=Anguilla anguilla TaxID=7936 RepID=A0A0E9UBQ2_ANGAN
MCTETPLSFCVNRESVRLFPSSYSLYYLSMLDIK